MRNLTSLVVACLLATSCGGRQAVVERAPGAPGPAAGIALPEPIPAAPAYLARLDGPAPRARIQALGETPGVAVVAPVRVMVLDVEGPNGYRNLRVGAVDPLRYRSVAPAATRDAEFVWAALMAGDAVVTFDAASALGISGPATISVAGSRSLRVAAIADNGSPDVADVLVAAHVGDELGMRSARLLVVGAETGTTIESLARPLHAKFPGATLTRIEAATPGRGPRPQPKSVAPQPQPGLLGSMRYQVLANGFIRPDPAWVRYNIATATVPVLGAVTCHRYMLPQLAAALAEIEQRGLAAKIYQYGGCYVPRFIDRDPRRALSMHAFGLAIDLNVPTNHLGTRGDMDPEIVAIFARWGFAWGGYWSQPDPMHFQLARLIRF